MAATFSTVDDYIASISDVQAVLEQVRKAIQNAAPGADETISYQMPTIRLDGQPLVHFAAWKHHIGMYPMPRAAGTLGHELEPYRTAKGTGRFPLREPMPLQLIERLVAQLVRQRT